MSWNGIEARPMRLTLYARICRSPSISLCAIIIISTFRGNYFTPPAKTDINLEIANRKYTHTHRSF
eukprot:956146-Pyramimonas_sp.AAC.1